MQSRWSRQMLIAKLTPLIPEAPRLFQIHQEGNLRRVKLTPVGIAIAHANLQRVSNFQADLGIWIT